MQRRTDTAQVRLPDHRRDRGSLRPSYRTNQGFVFADGVGACAGVHEYLIRGADGKARIVKELISDEVLKQDAGQIGRLPLTLHHPTVDVSPENIRELGVGDVGEKVLYIEDAQGGYVQLSICARRADAIAEMMAGTAVELSFGYDVLVKYESGIHPVYGAYDQKQVRRDYNHLALVDMARHGPEARVRVDAAEELPEGFIGLQLLPPRLDAIMTAVKVSPPATPPKTPAPGHGESMDFLKLLAARMNIPRWDDLTEDGMKSALRDSTDRLVKVADSVESAMEGRADIKAHELVADMVSSHSAFKAEKDAEAQQFASDMAAVQAERDNAINELNALKEAAAEKKTADDAAELVRTDAAVSAAQVAATEKAAAEAAMLALQTKCDAAEAALTAETGLKAAAEAALVAAQTQLDAVAAEEKKKADAADLAVLTGLAGELKVETEAEGKAKDLAVLRKDCAAVILGAEVPESYTDDTVAGILAPTLRRISDGLPAIAVTKDQRYTPHPPKVKVVDGSDTPKLRPSLRSVASSQHSGGTA